MIKTSMLAAIEIFEDLGKEVFCFLTLCVALPLLVLHYIDGSLFVDLVKSLGLAYLGTATFDKTAEKVRNLWQKRSNSTGQ